MEHRRFRIQAAAPITLADRIQIRLDGRLIQHKPNIKVMSQTFMHQILPIRQARHPYHIRRMLHPHRLLDGKSRHKILLERTVLQLDIKYA